MAVGLALPLAACAPAVTIATRHEGAVRRISIAPAGPLPAGELGEVGVVEVPVPAGASLNSHLLPDHGRATLRPGRPARVRITFPYLRPTRLEVSGRGVVIAQTLRVNRHHERPLAPGVARLEGVRHRADRVLRYHGLRLAPGVARRLRVVMAGPTIRARRTVPQMARGALAGINGGFFDLASGAPLGAVKIDREWIARPLFGRTALLLPRHGRPRIAAVRWTGAVAAGGRRLPIEAWNRTPGPAEACAVTTSRWGGPASFPGWVTTPAGRGVTVHTRAPLPGPPRVMPHAEPDVDGSMLGGGPGLVAGGKVKVSKVAERFRPDVAESLTARSGCGLTAAGELLLLSSEARPPYGTGVSLEDWASLLRDLGCQEAMGLDGHTMATLVIRDEVIGHPTAGAPQAVATALVVPR